MTRTWRIQAGAAALAALLLGGCNDFLASRMVAPPNGHKSLDFVGHSINPNETRMTVTSPPALLAFWVLEPKAPVKGTILVLHGFVADHKQVEGAAKALQKQGYRAVLVDLPGHGDSTADHITYGVDDAGDLKQLTDYLQKRNLCGDSVGVFGTSYGAASAIMYAAADPRVKAIVAVAPFASLREEAPYFGRHLLPVPGMFMSLSDFDSVVNTMGRDGKFDPDAASPLKAITHTTAEILLFHGTADMIVPSTASEELAAAGAGHSRLTLFPGKGHLDLCLDWFGQLQPQTADWFNKYLAVPTPAAGDKTVASH